MAEALIKSESLIYDEKQKEVRADGKVEIYQDGYVLTAERIIYNQEIDQVRAFGNVILTEPNGNVFTGDSLVLQDRLKQGVIEHFSAKFKGNVLLTASHATKKPPLVTLDLASYTSCPICDGKKPQWQIRSNKVVLNEDSHQIKYKNAFFDIYGLPVFYLPYFTHPSPKSPSKSGLLAPKLGFSKLLGRSITVPVYLNLASNSELLLTPMFTTEKGLLLSTEYNHLLTNGDYHFKGSIVKDREYSTPLYRHYLDSNAIVKINPHLQAGFDFKRASDKSYLKNYYFDDDEYLTTLLFSDYSKNNNSLSLEYIGFQRLRQTATGYDDSPHILPMVDIHLESDQFYGGSKLFLDNNLLGLYRDVGGQYNRISSNFGWNKPYLTESGHKFNFTSSVRTDYYDLRGYKKFQGNVTRILPELAIDWQYPLMKNGLDYNVIIMPRIASFISPTNKKQLDTPNEDSQFTEISDSNLWQSSHSTGLDFVETGTRINYGLDSNIYFKQGYNLNLLIGQNYRFNRDAVLTPATGMSGNFSDIVARSIYRPSEKLDLYYKARFDKNNLAIKSNEIGALIKLTPVSFNVAYVSFDNYLQGNPYIKRKEIVVKANLELKKWELSAEARQNLSNKQGKNFTYLGWGIIYHGDCVDFSTSFRKDLTRDLLINKKTNSMLLFSVNLKGIN